MLKQSQELLFTRLFQDAASTVENGAFIPSSTSELIDMLSAVSGCTLLELRNADQLEEFGLIRIKATRYHPDSGRTRLSSVSFSITRQGFDYAVDLMSMGVSVCKERSGVEQCLKSSAIKRATQKSQAELVVVQPASSKLLKECLKVLTSPQIRPTTQKRLVAKIKTALGESI